MLTRGMETEKKERYDFNQKHPGSPQLETLGANHEENFCVYMLAIN